jgi:FecR protein
MSKHDSIPNIPLEDDYLWDPSAPADAEIAELEESLQALRFERGAPDFESPRAEASSNAWWLLAAAAIALVVGWSLVREPEPTQLQGIAVAPPSIPTQVATALPAGPPVVETDGWLLSVAGGAPTCDGEVVDGETRLRPGTWLETNPNARAQVAVAEIGVIDVAVGTRMRIVSTTPTKHVVELDRGTIFVSLDAPPEQFVVHTRFGDVVDLGCRYVATVDDTRLSVEVTSGAVAIRRDDQEVKVPEGFGAAATLDSIRPAHRLHVEAPPVWRAPSRTSGGGAVWGP